MNDKQAILFSGTLFSGLRNLHSVATSLTLDPRRFQPRSRTSTTTSHVVSAPLQYPAEDDHHHCARHHLPPSSRHKDKLQHCRGTTTIPPPSTIHHSSALQHQQTPSASSPPTLTTREFQLRIQDIDLPHLAGQSTSLCHTRRTLNSLDIHLCPTTPDPTSSAAHNITYLGRPSHRSCEKPYGAPSTSTRLLLIHLSYTDPYLSDTAVLIKATQHIRPDSHGTWFTQRRPRVA